MMYSRREHERFKMPEGISNLSKPLVLVVEDEAALATMLVQQAFVVIGELTPSVPLSWGREGEGAVPMSNDWTSSFWTASRIG